MKLEEFRNALQHEGPPKVSAALTALWWDANGDWTRAHEYAQADKTSAGAWVHAYLHRKEGDLSNAAYWYSRAGKPVCRVALDEEWNQIATALLGRAAAEAVSVRSGLRQR